MNTPILHPSTPRRPAARLLAMLALASALGIAARLPAATNAPAPVLAQSPTPTPLPASSLAQLPENVPGPRPEPMGAVHVESSSANCVRNAFGEIGEAAVNDVMVRLKNSGGTILRQQPTNSNGIFDLYDPNVSLAEGSYQLDVVLTGTNWSFSCAQPGSAQSTVYSSPIAIESPGDYPEEMKVSIGVN